MYAPVSRLALLLLIFILAAGCANIVPPSGGDKDITPPRLIKVSPADSGFNVRTSRIRFDFDEYITVTDAGTQVIISPLLPVPPVVTSFNKHVTIVVPDSLLEPNTTYRITLGNAVRDLNENNVYKGRSYIFSTGAYFDSLSLSGNVTDATTGLPDTTTTILLYNAQDGDSAVVKKRPLYATHVDGSGNFTFQGLPGRRFNIYALRDKNANLVFDDPTEWVAFREGEVLPGQDSSSNIALSVFPAAGADTVNATGASRGGFRREASRRTPGSVGYNVAVDTSDTKKRSQDINRPLEIIFAGSLGQMDAGKFFLSYDSTGITTEAAVKVQQDTVRRLITLATPWAENTLYTLRLQKGFAKDTAGADYLPGRYTFRTKRVDDYASLTIHLPTKYYGKGYVLQVTNETDTIYKQPVLDSNVALLRIPPGNYKLLIIEDRNGNGIWDTGDLLARKQPERIIPFGRTILLKPGWENQQDFEPPTSAPPAKSPQKSSPDMLR
jgi:hypothetical protein